MTRVNPSPKKMEKMKRGTMRSGDFSSKLLGLRQHGTKHSSNAEHLSTSNEGTTFVNDSMC